MQIEKYQNYELKKHTSLKIGGKAKNVYFPKNIDEFVCLLKEKTNYIVLGNCSNTLISSQGIEEDIIMTSKIEGYMFEDTILTAFCGVKGPLLSRECQKLGLSGFEFMIGLPGTIGGMVYMNASAHNQQTSDTFIKTKVFDQDSKKIIELNKKDMEFSYRKSVLSSKNYILLEATFELSLSDKEKITQLMDRNIEFRKQRQPSLALPNAGSIFKNPENDSAGRLLEASGAKEFTIGGAKVWENHSNFIINFDNASSNDVIKLMYKMYNIVKEKYTIELRSEIKYVGTKSKEEEIIWQIITGENTALTPK